MFPPNGVPLRNEQGVPLPNGPLLTRLRPVPGHPLAALYAPVQQEPGAQGSEPPVPPAGWISLYPLACEWASFAQALPADLDSCRMTQAFQAVAMAFLALSHEESAYAHYFLVGNRLRYPPCTVAEGLEQVGMDLHEAVINWTAVGLWLEGLLRNVPVVADLSELVRPLIITTHTQQERVWALLLHVQQEYARLTGHQQEQEGTPS